MEDFKLLLGEDLITIVDELDGKIGSTTELTRLQSPDSSRACFKLQFKDGRIFKGRRFKSIDMRKTVTDLMPLLKGLPFSRVIAFHGIATIEEWVPGSPLKPDDISAERTRFIASVLGSLHSVKKFPAGLSPRTPDVEFILGQINSHLTKLAEQSMLNSNTVENLVELAESNRPSEPEAGLSHTDFHPGNMVIDNNGKITIIDNEDLCLGPLDFGVARCWTRMSMNREQREVFCDAYNTYRSLDKLISHQKFWAIRALTLSAFIHARYGKSNRQFVDVLRRISQRDNECVWPDLSPGISG